MFSDCCKDLSYAPEEYRSIISQFTINDASFDYLFFLARLRIAGSSGTKYLIKAIKNMKFEIRCCFDLDDMAINAQTPDYDD